MQEGIGACSIEAFQDNKVSEILELPKDVRPIGRYFCIRYPAAERPEKLEGIDVKALVHYEKYDHSDNNTYSFLLTFTVL